ncbi:FG-GAP-like repeat-containing protein [Streptosporangium sp. NPDC000396]|uniref:FG-GAP-like repeat-containing protein n=1 Tax=Streptosporangium sp. NPDC000396 TaxID=3366185 RepID=UPI0036BFE93C
MKAISGARKYVAGALALAACTAGWGLTGLPDTLTGQLAAGFSFAASPLGPAGGPGDRSTRPVAPGYENIRGWVSSTGAGVALFDVDNEVVSNDVCLVDPRHDTVTVRPAPGTPQDYRPFALAPPGRRPYEAPMGCLPADLDQDGWQDLVVYYWGRSPSLFLRVPGAPPSALAFLHRDLTAQPEIWNTNAATAGDFDGDGRLDLVFGNYFPDGAKVLDDTGDQGGVAMAGSLSDARDGGANRLYRATGPARFAEAEAAFDAAGGPGDGTGGRGWTLALGAQDLDGDGRPDLYVANDFGPDELLVNESAPGKIRFRQARGTRHLTTPRSHVLGEDSFKGMGVGFTDLNTDGTPDILVSNVTEDYGLHESNFAFVSRPGGFHEGHAPYDDRSEELGLSRTGWSWDVKAADFDNDGTDEIMHATGFVRGEVNRWAQLQEAAMSNDLTLSRPALWPNIRAGDDLSGRDTNSFFTRGADGRYADVARRAGVGSDTVGRAFAIGDVDDDGRLDFVVANQWAESVLYRNDGATAPFVGLRLRLPAGSCGTAAASAASAPADPTLTRSPLTRLILPAAPGAPLTLPRPPLTRITLPPPAPARQTPPGAASAHHPGLTRPAIGATARMRLPNGTTLSRQLYPAGGHNGVSAPELLFGLGAGAPNAPLPVDLSWRDACGVARTASVSVKPGWHRILLADGHASDMDQP